MMEAGFLQDRVEEHCRTVRDFFAAQAGAIERLVTQLVQCFTAGGTLLICGNGGSACDAMHIAGEFVGRFKQERRGLPAIALTADSSIITAVGNDYGFERVFARQVEAYGRPGSLLLALSTSGSSPNVLAALAAARAQGLYSVLLTGARGAGLGDKADMVLAVPSTDTARIQETHILLLHLLAEMTETRLMEQAA